MTCCVTAGGVVAHAVSEPTDPLSRLEPFQATLRLAVPGMHCGGCIRQVEKTLSILPGVVSARANLGAKSVMVQWRGTEDGAETVTAALDRAGFEAFALDAQEVDGADRQAVKDLLRRMAVAGFASANVMLLSVSVWSGASDTTRDLLHWVSALIAMPTVMYSGQPFFQSAWNALKVGRLNMDAPISLAVVLAMLASLIETARGGHEAYFDAAVMLLFLLLIGRLLDRMMRAKARGAAHDLARMIPRRARVLSTKGTRTLRDVATIEPGDVVELDAGQRAPVDGTIIEGMGMVDTAIVTGESLPVTITHGDRITAGTLALDAAFTLRADVSGEDSSLAEAARLCAAAEERKSRLACLADRAAAIYAPAVHLIALAAFIGWLVAGSGFGEAAMIAVAVLIVTCPCALGLAAPMAQATASGALFRRGIMLKDGAALERLATVDRAMFDKTGVLTLPDIQFSLPAINADMLQRAVSLARRSNHPLAQALAKHGDLAEAPALRATDVHEEAGSGIGGTIGGHVARLGSAAWCDAPLPHGEQSGFWYAEDGAEPVFFPITASLRPGVRDTLATLDMAGLQPTILSGDRTAPVAEIARSTGARAFAARLSPTDKLARIEAVTDEGHKVLMVGDGINDAPALSAASVSIAPSTAADIGRNAADIVFTGADLQAVSTAWRIARKTRTIILQNFAIALGYNMIAVPLAIGGFVTPMIAAIAMSASSLAVTINALRLGGTAR